MPRPFHGVKLPADRQGIFTAGWWAGYRCGRMDEQEGLAASERIAPKLPEELQHRPGAELGEILGRAVVIAAAVLGTLFACAAIILVIRAIAWLAGGIS